MSIEFCKCKLDAHRLMELGYWPATPSRPVLAFSLSMMDWMEALLLECQVAVQDFTSALKMLITEKFELVFCYTPMCNHIGYNHLTLRRFHVVSILQSSIHLRSTGISAIVLAGI